MVNRELLLELDAANYWLLVAFAVSTGIAIVFLLVLVALEGED